MIESKLLPKGFCIRLVISPIHHMRVIWKYYSDGWVGCQVPENNICHVALATQQILQQKSVPIFTHLIVFDICRFLCMDVPDDIITIHKCCAESGKEWPNVASTVRHWLNLDYLSGIGLG